MAWMTLARSRRDGLHVVELAPGGTRGAPAARRTPARASGLIGPMRRSSRSSSRARAVGVTPSDISRRLGGHRRVGLGVEVAAARPRPPSRGAASPRPRRARPGGPSRASPRGGARRRRARGGGRRAGWPRPAAPRSGGDGARAASASSGLDRRRGGRRRARPGDRPRSACRRGRRAGTSASRRASTDPSSRASTSARRRRRNSRRSAEPGGAHLEVGSQRTDGAGPLARARPWPRPSPGPRSAAPASSASSSGSAASSSATRARSRPRRSASSSAWPRERLLLGGGVAAVGLDALEAVGGGGEAAVVLVELRGPAPASAWRASSSSERAPCRLASAWIGRGGGRRGALAGLLERGAGGAGGRRCRRASPWRRSGCPRG